MLAIILKKSPVAENSEIITVLSRDFGKLRLSGRAVKSAKSKLSFGLQPLFESEVEAASGRRLPVITGVKVINAHQGLRESAEGITAGLLGAEFILRSTPDEQLNVALYDLFSSFLKHLSATGSAYMLSDSKAPWKFIVSALSTLGFGVDMNRCVICGTESGMESVMAAQESPAGLRPVKFSPRLGGVVCEACAARAVADAEPISHAARAFFSLPADDLEDFASADSFNVSSSEVRGIAERFSAYILERELKSSRFVV